MGLSYLNGGNWLDVTREERLFCSYLYHDIIRREKDFVAWLNKQPDSKALELSTQDDWEIGYEVCFYRDLLKLKDKPIRYSGYPYKRTFDLCMFSEKSILIIEAKVQQGFTTKQVREIGEDKDIHIPRLKKERILSDDIKVKTVLLASSCYFNNMSSTKRRGLIGGFPRITWKDIHVFTESPIYSNADDIYCLEHKTTENSATIEL